jgi:hypothetical protein
MSDFRCWLLEELRPLFPQPELEELGSSFPMVELFYLGAGHAASYERADRFNEAMDFFRHGMMFAHNCETQLVSPQRASKMPSISSERHGISRPQSRL